MVRRSSSACVGCSCMPSPALSTGRWVSASSSHGAPLELLAQNDRFSAERAQGQAGIFQRLAFFNARRKAGNQRRVRAQAFCGQLKAGAGARRGLVEEQRHAALGQDACAGQRVLILKSRGAREQMARALRESDPGRRAASRGCKETAMRRPAEFDAGGGLELRSGSSVSCSASRETAFLQSMRSTSRTCSSLSTSWNLTSIISRLLVGTCLPT